MNRRIAKTRSPAVTITSAGRMVFRIGTREYIVRRRWNLAMDQDKVDGLCDGTNHYIWLDGDVEEGALVDLLRHEHNHAWEFETAVPRTQEERANFNSTVGAAFDEEFVSQGGLKALKAIPIEGFHVGCQLSAGDILGRLGEIEKTAIALQEAIALLLVRTAEGRAA